VFAIDTDAMSEIDRRRAARFVLELLAPDVASFECDIPWSQVRGWPSDVRAAAEDLSALRRPRRSTNDSYRQTGVIQRTDDSIWGAFVTFAPYAFDAAAWGVDARELIDVADEGTSLVVRLSDSEARMVAQAVGDQVVVPLKTWRRRA